MPTVDFIVPVYSKDRDQLYTNIDLMIKSHKYDFNEVIIVHQNCKPGKLTHIDYPIKWFDIKEEDYDRILERFGIPANDPYAEEISGGTHWYYKLHLVNHLAGLMKSKADYVVFSDSDCIMVTYTPWIKHAIAKLEYPHVLVVSPSDGNPCETQIMSQQLFICNRRRLMDIDWNCWDEQFLEGGPFKFYYHMAEGRIGMYMVNNGLYRVVLDNNRRYWHGPEEHPVPDEYKPFVKKWVKKEDVDSVLNPKPYYPKIRDKKTGLWKRDPRNDI